MRTGPQAPSDGRGRVRSGWLAGRRWGAPYLLGQDLLLLLLPLLPQELLLLLLHQLGPLIHQHLLHDGRLRLAA